jgi:hypothetical protein
MHITAIAIYVYRETSLRRRGPHTKGGLGRDAVTFLRCRDGVGLVREKQNARPGGTLLRLSNLCKACRILLEKAGLPRRPRLPRTEDG